MTIGTWVSSFTRLHLVTVSLEMLSRDARAWRAWAAIGLSLARLTDRTSWMAARETLRRVSQWSK